MGVAAGIGAAMADALFGFISGLGASAFLTAIGEVWHLRLLAIVLILFIGVKHLRNNPSPNQPLINQGHAGRATLTTFLLTISNPVTILGFAGIFVGLGVAIEAPSLTTASLLGLGIFIGSTMWWLLLSFAANKLQQNLNFNLSLLSKISGSLMIGFGILLLISLL